MRATGYPTAKESFSDCTPAPEGTWIGKLKFKSWGKKTNLHCFFENYHTGELHSMSAFRSRNGTRTYSPRDGLVDFSEAGIEGCSYELVTKVNSKGNTAWLSAKNVEDNG